MKLTQKYWELVDKIAIEIKSDGCSKVPDFYLQCCSEHDVHYYFARRISVISGRADGPTITFDEANAQLKKCIQSRSWWGKWSPMAWWRYKGVENRIVKHIWDKHRERERRDAIRREEEKDTPA